MEAMAVRTNATLAMSATAEFNIAETIGETVLKSAVGNLTDLAIGAVLENLGLGDTTSSQLAAINQRLDKIDKKLDLLDEEVKVGFDQASFDRLIMSVQDLVNLNGTMLDLFRAATKDPATRAAYAGELRRQLNDNSALVDKSRRAWDSAIRGLPGQAGLLQAKGKLLFDSSGVYGPAQAGKMHAFWDWLDGHQALSALFYAVLLADRHAAEPSPVGASFVINHLNLWQEDRRKQLNMLRGPAADSARVLTFKPDGSIDSETVSLAKFPDVVLWKSGALALYQHISAPRALQLQPPIDLVQQAETATGLSGWSLIGPDSFKALANENGGRVGSGEDFFHAAFRSLGFQNIPECMWVGQIGVYFIDLTPCPSFTCFIEGKTWWNPAPPDFQAGVLLAHGMTNDDWLKLCWKA